MIIDCAWNTKKHIYKLLEEGVVCVIRYYNYKNSTHLPEKGLTLDEAKALSEQVLMSLSSSRPTLVRSALSQSLALRVMHLEH